MVKNHVDIWSNFLKIIKENLNEQSYNTWFKPIIPLYIEKKQLTVQIPSQFFYEFLETHYNELIKNSLEQTLENYAKLIYSVVVNDNVNTSEKSCYLGFYSVYLRADENLMYPLCGKYYFFFKGEPGWTKRLY